MNIIRSLERHQDLKCLRDCHQRHLAKPEDKQLEQDFEYYRTYCLSKWGEEEVRQSLCEATRPHLFLKRNQVV